MSALPSILLNIWLCNWKLKPYLLDGMEVEIQLLLNRFPDSSFCSLMLVGWCEERHPATKNLLQHSHGLTTAWWWLNGFYSKKSRRGANLRSAAQVQLLVPRFRKERTGRRGFSISSPQPVELTSSRHSNSIRGASSVQKETENSSHAAVHFSPLWIYVTSATSTTTTTTTILK